MNAKTAYWRALGFFIERNATILPQMQLQAGANERWFVREFAIAMNRHFGGRWAPKTLRRYADCERSRADISVWSGHEQVPDALYEAKVLYNGQQSPNLMHGIARKARAQLETSPLVGTDRKLGLFFAIYTGHGPTPDHAKVRTFKSDVRAAVKASFRSDHDIRLTALSPMTSISYVTSSGKHPWHTQSWITWGTPGRL